MARTTFATKVGKMRYNVREVIAYPGNVYWSSLGYQGSLTAARELADRVPGRHTVVVDADGKKHYEHLPE